MNHIKVINNMNMMIDRKSILRMSSTWDEILGHSYLLYPRIRNLLFISYPYKSHIL